jgi:hypothetical protein
MGSNGCGMDVVYTVITVLVILVVVYLGCTELRRMGGGASGATSARRGTNAKSARAAVAFKSPLEESCGHGAPPASPREPARHEDAKPAVQRHEADDADAFLTPAIATDAHGTADLTDAFEPMHVDPSLVRIVEKDASQIPDDVFLADFHEADPNAFQPIDKERAKASASIRPAQSMQHDRDDGKPPARTIGLSPMEFARRTIPRPPRTASDCPMPFNEVDARYMQSVA